jgi:hypothetical protein
MYLFPTKKAVHIMRKRGRPRKNPPPEPENNSDDGEDIIPQKSENPTENENPTEASLEETITDSPQPIDSKQSPTDASQSIEIPEEWKDVPILDLAKQGWTYRRKPDKRGIEYMHIRNRTNERGLGRWSPEREKLFFELYPILYKPKGVEIEPPALTRTGIDLSSEKGLGKRPFFNVPIKRIAVIPGDYRPTLDVVRYYHIYKNNGFLGDFSDFMNGIIATHFVKCHGIVLPVYVNEELIQ